MPKTYGRGTCLVCLTDYSVRKDGHPSTHGHSRTGARREPCKGTQFPVRERIVRELSEIIATAPRAQIDTLMDTYAVLLGKSKANKLYNDAEALIDRQDATALPTLQEQALRAALTGDRNHRSGMDGNSFALPADTNPYVIAALLAARLVQAAIWRGDTVTEYRLTESGIQAAEQISGLTRDDAVKASWDQSYASLTDNA